MVRSCMGEMRGQSEVKVWFARYYIPKAIGTFLGMKMAFNINMQDLGSCHRRTRQVE